ncbi:hypothetical protein QR721_04540 [Aciduricibacillus chroicocephali]|uniref:Uncharacterized protein n=1 Tax=Aciduricibacillus chroicocephali TaxID=3054939 RepID=A0ABY9KX91_9BACI|nr:hypothetical protein QR721_04540 [Bacillaceae bacterium 44XB]
MKKLHIAPAAPAAIMAIGIFLVGSIEQFPCLDKDAGPWVAAFVILLWMYMYSLLILQMLTKEFRHNLLKGPPINFFAIGTWIAAVSVLCNVALKYYSGLHPLIQITAVVNIFCWTVFTIIAAMNLFRLFTLKGKDAHGMILLAAVATQSAIIMSHAAFVHMPDWTLYSWIFIGFTFYIAGIVLLIMRYSKWQDWKLSTDWKNTNCIIHGALSISGVAMAVSGLFPFAAILYCWLAALFMLILVECFEIARAFQRISLFGMVKGLFIFDMSQWARNFTFGMFYLLTHHLLVRLPNTVPVSVISLLEQLLTVWGSIVIIFLIIEFSIALLSVFQKKRQKKQKAEPSS